MKDRTFLKFYLIFIASILLGYFLDSCTASHHIQKMQKHKEKAEEKGAKFEKEIEYKYIFETDTITDTLTNEVEIIKRVVDSVKVEREKLIYIPLSRQERIKIKDSLKHIERMKDTQIDSLEAELKAERLISKDNNKTAIKTQKIEVKTQKFTFREKLICFFFALGALIIGFFASIIINFFRKFTKGMP